MAAADAVGEQVWVVRRSDFFGGNWPQGFVPLPAKAGARLVRQLLDRGFLVPRAEAEDNPAWQQPIPYCVLTSGTETFCVRRRRAGTEVRLHGRYSVGLGGHLGPADLTADGDGSAMQACLERELTEELVIPRALVVGARLRGLLKDDSDPVGQVHAGLVYELQVPPAQAGNLAVREISKLRGGFTPLVELRDLWQDPGRFETWSQILLEAWMFPKEEPGKRADHRGAHAREEQYEGGEEDA